jgi:hypothetical protein
MSMVDSQVIVVVGVSLMLKRGGWLTRLALLVMVKHFVSAIPTHSGAWFVVDPRIVPSSPSPIDHRIPLFAYLSPP